MTSVVAFSVYSLFRSFITHKILQDAFIAVISVLEISSSGFRVTVDANIASSAYLEFIIVATVALEVMGLQEG